MITGFYAGILGLLYFNMSLTTIKARRKHQVSLGPGQNDEIAPIVSAHGNFAAYVPLFLILLFIVETQGEWAIPLIHILAVLFLIGRFLHFKALTAEKMNFKFRKVGMHLTFWPLLTVSSLCIYDYLRTMING
jgi:uncharacterized membrane protein YecN with MAPEG domain